MASACPIEELCPYLGSLQDSFSVLAIGHWRNQPHLFPHLHLTPEETGGGVEPCVPEEHLRQHSARR